MKFTTVFSAAAIVLAAAGAASAASVSVDTYSGGSTVTSSSTFDNCNGSCGVTNVGLSSGQYRSPFGDDSSEYYFYVQAGSEGYFNYASAQTSLTFLWGSPDTYNTLTFYDVNGDAFDSVVPDGSVTWQPNGLGAKYVTIVPTAAFYSIGFSSGSNAFEFANVTTTPVPLPAAGLLLVGALGGLAAASRKRRA